MERPLAEKIVEAALALDHQFGLLDTLVSQIQDEAERKAYARALGCLIVDTYIGLMRPIVAQYPDLEPDGTRANP